MSEETLQEFQEDADRRFGPTPPPSEAALAYRERANAGLEDTMYFSIRYEESRYITRGTTPYFLGDLMKATARQLYALYKMFPDDPHLLLHMQVIFCSGWPEIKAELDLERAALMKQDDEQ